MMDGRLFDKLELIARLVRKSYHPFGGIQLVLCGDFYQLPPVEDKSYRFQMPSLLAFEARRWDVCIQKTILLKQVFRQKDEMFLSVLGAMRKGQLNIEQIRFLQSLSRPLTHEDGIEPTFLFPKKDRALACNAQRLAALPGPEFTFDAQDSIGYDYEGVPIPVKDGKELLDRLIVQSTVSLKVGAQVMLLKNMTHELVNGSVGKVEGFMTIHEAMERRIAIASPTLADEEEQLRKSELRVVSDKQIPKGEKYPMVVFDKSDDEKKPYQLRLLCAPLEFSAEGFMGNTEVTRYQVPLSLAWAMSIHKSQGQTLDRVKIDLGETFEKGQAYVAVSRATGTEGLEIINFDPGKVMAHPKVLKWERNLEQDMIASFEDEMDTEEASISYWEHLTI